MVTVISPTTLCLSTSLGSVLPVTSAHSLSGGEVMLWFPMGEHRKIGRTNGYG